MVAILEQVRDLQSPGKSNVATPKEHTAPSIDYISIMRQLSQWMPWRSEPKPGEEKLTKRPYDFHTGRPGSFTTSSHQGTHTEVKAACQRKNNKYNGIGFVSWASDPFSVIDLDGCRDPDTGEASLFAQDIIRRLDSLTLVSPSKTGYRIIVAGKLPANLGANKKLDGDCRIEIKSVSGFSTITTELVPGTPATIAQRQEELTAIYREALARRAAAKEHSRVAKQHTPVTGSLSRHPEPVTGTDRDTSYGLAALRAECSELATTPEGGRNTALNLCAFILGRLVAGEALDQFTVEREIIAACKSNGLWQDDGEERCAATLQSGLNSGMLHPRSAPPLENTVPYTPTQEEHATNGNGNGHHQADEQTMTWEQALARIAAQDREIEQLRNDVAFLRPFKAKYELRKRLDKIPNKVADPTTKLVFEQCGQVFEKRLPRDDGMYPIVSEYMATPIGSTDGTVLSKLQTLAANNIIEYESTKDPDTGHWHTAIKPLNFTIEALAKSKDTNHGGTRVAIHKGCGGICKQRPCYTCTKCGVDHLSAKNVRMVDQEKWERWQAEDAAKRAEQPAEPDEPQTHLAFGPLEVDTIPQTQDEVGPECETGEEVVCIPETQTQLEFGISPEYTGQDAFGPPIEPIGDLLAAMQEASASRTPEESAAIKERNQREWDAMQSAKDRAEQYQQEHGSGANNGHLPTDSLARDKAELLTIGQQLGYPALDYRPGTRLGAGEDAWRKALLYVTKERLAEMIVCAAGMEVVAA